MEHVANPLERLFQSDIFSTPDAMLAVALLAIMSIARTPPQIQVSAEKTESELRGNTGLPQFHRTHESGSGDPVARKLLTEPKAQATRVVSAPAMHNFVQVIRGFTAKPFRKIYRPHGLPLGRQKQFFWLEGDTNEPNMWEIGEEIIIPIMNKVLNRKEGTCDEICKNHEMESAFMRNCFDGYSGNCCEALNGSGGWDVGGCDCGPKVSCNLLPFDADPKFQGCGLTLPLCK